MTHEPTPERRPAIAPTAPLRAVHWTRATRIIAARFPPIHLYERVSTDPAVWDALIELESRVNPRLRDEAGEIRLVAPDDRVSGAGASFVMSAFTHLNPAGSRFSDGSYGVYYAARERATAIAETAFHFGRLARDANDPPRYEDFRILEGPISERLHDLARVPPGDSAPLLDPDSYSASQRWARSLRESGSRGIHYPSVRRPMGRSVAMFRAKSVGLPRTAAFLQYHWDGAAVRRYFDYGRNEWCALHR